MNLSSLPFKVVFVADLADDRMGNAGAVPFFIEVPNDCRTRDARGGGEDRRHRRGDRRADDRGSLFAKRLAHHPAWPALAHRPARQSPPGRGWERHLQHPGQHPPAALARPLPPDRKNLRRRHHLRHPQRLRPLQRQVPEGRGPPGRRLPRQPRPPEPLQGPALAEVRRPLRPLREPAGNSRSTSAWPSRATRPSRSSAPTARGPSKSFTFHTNTWAWLWP